MNNHSRKPRIGKKTILVADDDPGILDAMSEILDMVGYHVITAIDGEAIYKMEKDYPDLLLLDIWMSGMDGRDICKYLKSHDYTKKIPIIMVSANRDTEKIARDAGADDFLTKPFEMNDLLKKIESFIGE